SLFCRLKHCQAYFERRFAPAAAVKHRPVVHDGIIQLFNLCLTPSPARRQSELSLFLFTINATPIGSLANIASFAAHQGEAKERLLKFARPDMAELAFALPAETHPLFKLLFLSGAARLPKSSSNFQVRFRISVLSSFSHPTKELRRVEKAIAAINQSRRRAVFELQIPCVASFVLARFVPDASHGTHAAHHAAADEPHDIDVVRSLV